MCSDGACPVAGQPGTQPTVRGAQAQQGFPQEPERQVAASGQEEATAGSVHYPRRAERPA